MQHGHARWHVALEDGIAPVAVELVAASSMIIAGAADRDAGAWAITMAAGLVLV